MSFNLRALLEEMIEKEASDLHITLGAPPMLRVDGLIVPTSYPKLSAEVCQRLIEVALRFSDLLAERVERRDRAFA